MQCIRNAFDKQATDGLSTEGTLTRMATEYTASDVRRAQLVSLLQSSLIYETIAGSIKRNLLRPKPAFVAEGVVHPHTQKFIGIADSDFLNISGQIKGTFYKLLISGGGGGGGCGGGWGGGGGGGGGSGAIGYHSPVGLMSPGYLNRPSDIYAHMVARGFFDSEPETVEGLRKYLGDMYTRLLTRNTPKK